MKGVPPGRQRTVAANAVALYGVHLVNLALPLVTIPYLARTLGPSAWGPVLAGQSLAIWTAVLLEYGFSLSATREVARRIERSAVTDIVAGVLGAKVVLLAASLLTWIAASVIVPVFRERPEMALLGWLAGVVQSLNPFWFFQGVQRLRLPATVYVLSRVAMTIGIFLIVRNPGDAWLVLGLQVLSGLASTAVSLVLMYRMVAWASPTKGNSLAALRLGRSMFVYRGAVSLYTVANTLIVSLFVPASQIAFFGGAERLSRAALSSFSPISQAIFPHMSRAIIVDRCSAADLAIRTLGILMAISLGSAAVGWVAAPMLIELLLGSAFSESVDILRVLLLSWPAVAASTVLGVQWMVPYGLDRAFNATVGLAAAANVVLAFVLVPTFGPIAMAWTVVGAETLVAIAMLVVLRRSGRDPFSVRRTHVHGEDSPEIS